MYYKHTNNISHEEKEAGLLKEMDKFFKKQVEISGIMSCVCEFFHAAISLERDNLFMSCFNPGASIFLKS